MDADVQCFCAMDAGEEGPASNIRDAITYNHAERIDHGLAAVEDEELLLSLIRNKVPLTVCPLSNVCLRACRSVEEHPLLKCHPHCGLLQNEKGDEKDEKKENSEGQKTMTEQLREDMHRKQTKQGLDGEGKKGVCRCICNGVGVPQRVRSRDVYRPDRSWRIMCGMRKSVSGCTTTAHYFHLSVSCIGAFVSVCHCWFSKHLSTRPGSTGDPILPSPIITGSRISPQYPGLIDMGLKVTISSDDPAFFGGGVYNNYRAIIETNSWSGLQQPAFEERDRRTLDEREDSGKEDAATAATCPVTGDEKAEGKYMTAGASEECRGKTPTAEIRKCTSGDNMHEKAVNALVEENSFVPSNKKSPGGCPPGFSPAQSYSGAHVFPVLRESLHWKLDTVKQVVINGVEASFLTDAEKQRLLRDVKAFDIRFRCKYAIDPPLVEHSGTHAASPASSSREG